MRPTDRPQLRGEGGQAGRCVEEREIAGMWLRPGACGRNQADSVRATGAPADLTLAYGTASGARPACAHQRADPGRTPTIEGRMLAIADGRDEVQAQPA